MYSYDRSNRSAAEQTAGFGSSPVSKFTDESKKLLRTLTEAVSWTEKIQESPNHLNSLEMLEGELHTVLNECFDKLQKVQHEVSKAKHDKSASYDFRRTAGADAGATAELRHAGKMLDEVFKKCQAVKEPVQKLETFEVFEEFLKKHVKDGDEMLVKVKKVMHDIEQDLYERDEQERSDKYASR